MGLEEVLRNQKIEVECPNCKNKVVLKLTDKEAKCPSCGVTIKINAKDLDKLFDAARKFDKTMNRTIKINFKL